MGSLRIATGSDQQHPAAVTTSRRHRPAADANPTGRRLAVLSVTALGVVYGDIGTSPLYAFRACFSPEYGLPRTAATVYGVLSIIVWSLILIVSVKYILIICGSITGVRAASWPSSRSCGRSGTTAR